MLKAERDELRENRWGANPVIRRLLDDLDASDAKLAQCRAAILEALPVLKSAESKSQSYRAVFAADGLEKFLSDEPAEHPAVAHRIEVKFRDVAVGQRFFRKGREMLRLGYQTFGQPIKPLVTIETDRTGSIFDATAVGLDSGLLHHVWPDEDVEILATVEGL